MSIVVKVGLASCGVAAGAAEVYDTLLKYQQGGADIELKKTACIGMCFEEPIVELSGGSLGKISLGKVDSARCRKQPLSWRTNTMPAEIH